MEQINQDDQKPQVSTSAPKDHGTSVQDEANHQNDTTAEISTNVYTKAPYTEDADRNPDKTEENDQAGISETRKVSGNEKEKADENESVRAANTHHATKVRRNHDEKEDDDDLYYAYDNIRSNDHDHHHY